MQGRLAQPEHRDVHRLSRLTQAGIGDVADQERVIALRLGAMGVAQHLGGLDEFQVAILIARTADILDPRDMDLCVRVLHRIQDGAQHARISAPFAHPRQALVP